MGLKSFGVDCLPQPKCTRFIERSRLHPQLGRLRTFSPPVLNPPLRAVPGVGLLEAFGGGDLGGPEVGRNGLGGVGDPIGVAEIVDAVGGAVWLRTSLSAREVDRAPDVLTRCPHLADFRTFISEGRSLPRHDSLSRGRPAIVQIFVLVGAMH